MTAANGPAGVREQHKYVDEWHHSRLWHVQLLSLQVHLRKLRSHFPAKLCETRETMEIWIWRYPCFPTTPLAIDHWRPNSWVVCDFIYQVREPNTSVIQGRPIQQEPTLPLFIPGLGSSFSELQFGIPHKGAWTSPPNKQKQQLAQAGQLDIVRFLAISPLPPPPPPARTGGLFRHTQHKWAEELWMGLSTPRGDEGKGDSQFRLAWWKQFHNARHFQQFLWTEATNLVISEDGERAAWNGWIISETYWKHGNRWSHLTEEPPW
jgi:hypothetical protein